MAEKFRRIRREPLKIPFDKKWIYSIVFLVIMALGLVSFLWWYPGARETSSQIQIKDKTLAAAVCQAEGCFWVNREGVSHKKSGEASGNMILTVEDKTGRALKEGSEVLKPETLAELLFLRERVREELGLILGRAETLDTNLTDFDFTTSEGWKLRLTTAENAYKTIAMLKQSLAEITKSGPTALLDYVDLRVPNKVYYKFRN